MELNWYAESGWIKYPTITTPDAISGLHSILHVTNSYNICIICNTIALLYANSRIKVSQMWVWFYSDRTQSPSNIAWYILKDMSWKGSTVFV